MFTTNIDPSSTRMNWQAYLLDLEFRQNLLSGPLHVAPAFAYPPATATGTSERGGQPCHEILSLPILSELIADQQRSVVATISSLLSE